MERSYTFHTGVSSFSDASKKDVPASAWERGTFNYYVLIFDKISGGTKVQYLLVDTASKRPRLLPKLNTVTMTKLKDTCGYRTVVLNNHLYVLGGRHITAGSYLNLCYRFDPRNNSWQRKAPLLRARSRFTATALDGYLYVCGGETRGGSITDIVECYDPVTDVWTEMRPMPTPLADHAACVVSGKLIVSGGTNGEKNQRGGTDTFWLYEPLSDYWCDASESSLLPDPRHRHCMTHVKDTIYCFGGITTTRQDRKTIDVEDPSLITFDGSNGNIDAKITGKWNSCYPSMLLPRSTAGCFVLGHDIYIIGGHSYAKDQSELMIECFNTRKRHWTEAFTLGKGEFSSVDCCVLKVPTSNKEFSTLGIAMNNKWILW